MGHKAKAPARDAGDGESAADVAKAKRRAGTLERNEIGCDSAHWPMAGLHVGRGRPYSATSAAKEGATDYFSLPEFLHDAYFVSPRNHGFCPGFNQVLQSEAPAQVGVELPHRPKELKAQRAESGARFGRVTCNSGLIHHAPERWRAGLSLAFALVAQSCLSCMPHKTKLLPERGEREREREREKKRERGRERERNQRNKQRQKQRKNNT